MENNNHIRSLVHQSKTPCYSHRVVVMGAGGFVGSHLILALKGVCETIALTRKEIDLLQPKSGERLASILQEGDILVITSALAPCKSGEMLIDNLKMMEEICKAIAQKKPAHLLYVSSDAVYKDSMDRLTERSCAEPDSFHGVMHLAREVMLKNSFSGPFAIIRPTLIYGARDPHNGYGPNQFIRRAMTHEQIVLFGKGEELRDHISVKDVAQIIRYCIGHRSEGVINAISGHEISFFEIASLAKRLAGTKIEIQENQRKGPMPHRGYRAFDSKERRLAFPEFECRDLEKGFQEMIQELSENKLNPQ